jgi:dihydropteroate synthase
MRAAWKPPAMNANGFFNLRIRILSLRCGNKMIWKAAAHNLDLSTHARVMGILNVTPDSFSDGGKFSAHDTALAHARCMIAEGATIIDIGGESTRPGATPVKPEEEILRTIPVIRSLRAEWDGLISIDTTKAAVAQAALAAGADILNDVSGLTADREMIPACVASNCGIVIMHMQGTPGNMQENPSYSDVLEEVTAFFRERLNTISAAGIDPARICFDPGIGFGKTLAHNLVLLRNLEHLAPEGFPLLLGVSRKSFIGKLTATDLPADRNAATIALTTAARLKGIMLHRVHDVSGNLAALRIIEALQ